MKIHLKRFIPLLILLLFWLPGNSQHDHNWTTGTVNINFDGGTTPDISDVSSGLAPDFWPPTGFQVQEGVATVSDAAGDLLYYSNGVEVYDGTTHLPIPGGPLLGTYYSSQSATMLPRPGGTCDDYVLITADASGLPNGQNYYFFDGTGYTGPGTVGPNFGLRLLNESGNPAHQHEGVGVVPHPNCVEYWIITHSAVGDTFRVYLLTPDGIESSTGVPEEPFHSFQMGISLAAPVPGDQRMAAGMIKASREGDKVAMTSFTGGIQVLDFDPVTGILSNEHDLTPTAPGPDAITHRSYFYGIEFSYNGDWLYFSRLGGISPVSNRGLIFSYDVSSPTPVFGNTLFNSNTDWTSALQRGPDSEIYFARRPVTAFEVSYYLGRVIDPEIGGTGVNPTHISMTGLGGAGVGLGLPAIYDYPTPEIEVTDDDTCDLRIDFCETNMRCLHDTNYSIILDYVWDFGDGTTVTTTDPCLTHDFPGFGDYEVVVTVDDPRFCSPQSDTVLVSINSCCPANPDHEYLENSVITEDTYWDGQVLIGAGVTVTVATGVTLDITNTDVLFDACGRIVMEDGSFLRANNSVFRPCLDHHVWRGIIFEGAAYGIINENTFKNAVSALSFEGPTSSARVTNNLFTDCKVSILMDSVQFSEGITGNTFQTEDSEFDYTNFACFEELPTFLQWIAPLSMFNTGHLDIAINQSIVYGKISHNDFINVEDQTASPNTVKLTNGIYMVTSTAQITSNRFSGYSISIFHSEHDAIPANTTVIENNEMEVSLGNGTSDNQIILAATGYVQVLGNTITSTQPVQAGPGHGNGIWAFSSTNLRINSNQISGFRSGIRLETVQNSSVTENTIEKCTEEGIVIVGSRNTRIGCNTINMELALTNLFLPPRFGIRVIDNAGPIDDIDLVEIHSNCIFETDFAISLETTDTPDNFDWIRNNYLYNYRVAGVFTNGYTVSVGSSPAYADAGRNTFMSNNLSAADLFAAGPGVINATGNFGVLSTATPGGGAVNIFPADNFHSTASCGHHIDDVGEALLDNELCDRYWEDNALIFPAKANPETMSKVLELIHSEVGDGESNPAQVDLLVRNWNGVTGEEDAIALDALAKSEEPLAFLASFTLKRESWWYPLAPISRKFEAPVRGELSYLEGSAISVYPNPAHDRLTVQVNDLELEEGTLTVYDAMGRQIQSLSTRISVGEMSLDVSELIPGVYFIKVTDQNDIQITKRFVVQ